jgi:hypothetical protein
MEQSMKRLFALTVLLLALTTISFSQWPNRNFSKVLVDSSLQVNGYERFRIQSVTGTTIDWNLAQYFKVALTGNKTLNHINKSSGRDITVIASSGSVASTITWPDTIVWINAPPTNLVSTTVLFSFLRTDSILFGDWKSAIWDTIAPNPVTDLSVTGVTTTVANLSWTVPAGTVWAYYIKYAEITPGSDTTNWWAAATQFGYSDYSHTAPGQTETKAVTGLTPSTTYYFMVRSTDQSGNLSYMGVPVANTTTADVGPTQVIPGAPTAFAVDSTDTNNIYLSWTSSGRDTSSGTAAYYTLAYGTSSFGGGELITNTSMETSITGWSSFSGSGTVSRASTKAYSGSYSLKYIAYGTYDGVLFPVTCSQAGTCSLSAYVYVPSVQALDTLDFYVLDHLGNPIDSFHDTYVATNTWVHIQRSITVAGTQTQMKFGVQFNPGKTGDSMFVDLTSMRFVPDFVVQDTATSLPAPSVSGTHQTYTLASLSKAYTYYMALKATNDVGNHSVATAVLSATTKSGSINPQAVTGYGIAYADSVTVGDYYVAKTGNDGYAGTYAAPFLTIGKGLSMLNQATGKDTLCILAGTYTDSLVGPTHSGTAGQQIVVTSYGKDSVIWKGNGSGLDGNGARWGDFSAIANSGGTGNYWTFQGIRFKPDYENSMCWKGNLITLQYATGIQFKYCEFYRDNSILNQSNLRNATTQLRCMYLNECRGTQIIGCKLSEFNEGIIHFLSDSHPAETRIAGNYFYHMYWNDMIMSSDYQTPFTPAAVLIENNYAGNTIGEDGIQWQYAQTSAVPIHYGYMVRNNIFSNNWENSLDLKGIGRSVIQDNYLFGSLGDDNGPYYESYTGGPIIDNWGGYAIDAGVNEHGGNTIIRSNVIYWNQGGIRPQSGQSNFYIYNNTLWDNSNGYTSQGVRALPTGLWIYVASKIYNNIVINHSGAEVAYNNSAGIEVDYNMYYNFKGATTFGYTTGGGVWPTTTNFNTWRTSYINGTTWADAHSSVTDPMLVNVPEVTYPTAEYTEYDFRPAPGSPALNASRYLTRTSGASSGTTMTVGDAGFFMSDSGLTLNLYGVYGDSIVVQDASPDSVARIINIDYNTNQLTLSTSLTWGASKDIFLWRNGRRRDDIGGIER